MTSTVGNKNLISSEEERIAAFLRERNLEKTNRNDQPVHPADNLYVRYVKRILDLLIGVPVFVVLLPFNCGRTETHQIIVGKEVRVVQPFDCPQNRKIGRFSLYA